ncbi:MAG TPA: histidine phosphatase family protein, partial [Acidothermaceae bacterium]
LLVRHGLTALTGPVLAGRTPGVDLDERGRTQAAAVAQRLAGVAVQAIVSSPLERCVQTAEFIAKERDVTVETDARLIECGYGDWTGQEINKLAKDPLWKVVQAHPSAVTFPGEGGEAMRDAQVRAVDAVRSWNTKLGADAIWVACSHADIIKSVVADALGMHLDTFQRIVVDPCSVTVISYTALRPFVVRVNDTGTDLATLLKPPAKGRRSRAKAPSSDAVVGGGAGAK